MFVGSWACRRAGSSQGWLDHCSDQQGSPGTGSRNPVECDWNCRRWQMDQTGFATRSNSPNPQAEADAEGELSDMSRWGNDPTSVLAGGRRSGTRVN